MAQPYIGEIRMFAGTFAPAGWAFCNGATIPISENDTLFALIGTTYGGDGEETFQLPDLQGRLPIHFGTAPSGTTYQIGERSGVETVTINTNTTPKHTHAFLASTGPAAGTTPVNGVLGESAQINVYIEDVVSASMFSGALQPIGGSQPHDNMQPYLVVSYIISLYGIFPSQT